MNKKLWSFTTLQGQWTAGTSLGNPCVFEEMDSKFHITHKWNLGTQPIFWSRGLIIIYTKGCLNTCGNLDAGMSWVRTKQISHHIFFSRDVNHTLCLLLFSHSYYCTCVVQVEPSSCLRVLTLIIKEIIKSWQTLCRTSCSFSLANVCCIEFKLSVFPVTPSL